MTPLEEAVEAAVNSATDEQLTQTVRDLDAKPAWRLTDAQCRVKGWACDELERRYPQVAPFLDDWADSDGTEPYGAVLLRAVADAKAAVR